MAKTQQTRIVDALVACGWATKVDGKSKKYITLKAHERTGRDLYYFVGKAGSLRSGRIFTESFPLSDEFKKNLIRYSVRADAVAASVE